jgi:hypothetical protein
VRSASEMRMEITGCCTIAAFSVMRSFAINSASQEM